MIPRCNAPGSLKDSYLGPNLPGKLSRKYLSYSSNQAAAYVPDALISSRYLKEIRAGAKVESYVKQPAITADLLDSLKDDIENHVETRIQSFLYQMILTYNTGIQFIQCTHAELQVGQVKAKPNSERCYAAAHSGTLTTLRISNGSSDNTSIAFGKDSSFYHNWNITVYLPTLVNCVDSDLDSTKRHSSDGESFRFKATEILNRVSSGEISPRRGLRFFLKMMIEIIDALKDSKRNQLTRKILRRYSKVAESYNEKINSDNTFLQKLLFRSTTEKVNFAFYSTVQADIHTQFKIEMQRLMPKIKAPIPLVDNFNAKLILNEIMIKRSELRGKDSKIAGVASEYINRCVLSDKVKRSAIAYFNSLNELSTKKLNKDLDQLTDITLFKNHSDIGLSPQALSFYKAVHGEINKDAQRMPLILFSILAELLIKIKLDKSEGPKDLTDRSTRKFIKVINNKIEEANLEITQTASDYTKLCGKNEKVKKAAKNFLSDLCIVSQTDYTEEQISLILTIKNTAPHNLIKSAYTFHTSALKAIRNIDPNKKEINPQNMGLILCRTLVRILS